MSTIFLTLLFKLSLSVVCLQGFVGTKCRNSGTSMLAYVSEAPAWRGRVQCHTQWHRCKAPKSLRNDKKKDSALLHLEGGSTESRMAEKQGFEPWLRFSRTTPLAGEPLRPLGYFSKVLSFYIKFLFVATLLRFRSRGATR